MNYRQRKHYRELLRGISVLAGIAIIAIAVWAGCSSITMATLLLLLSPFNADLINSWTMAVSMMGGVAGLLYLTFVKLPQLVPIVAKNRRH